MSLRNRWNEIVDHIRVDLNTNGGVDVELDTRTTAVLLLSSVLLTLFYYFGRPPFFRGELEMAFVGALGLDTSEFRGIFPYVYWSLASLVLRVAIPLGCIWFWFRESARDYGFRMPKKGHWKIYLGLYLVMLPVLVGISFTDSFQGKYPFYDAAGESLTHFLAYEAAYSVQFFSLEAFFRGFLVFALFKRFGYHAVTIMTIPYCMIHFGKPPAESLGAIVAGMLLGYLALKSKSWLPGAFLHFGVGLTLDVLCIAQEYFRGQG
ncbi:MAG: CPBP family glutamic-type intramembrane protease [Myxococcota bacterium]